jgi:hypothetical protein
MATASIRFDGQPGNYVGLTKGTPVVVTNNDNSGVTSWIYELVGKPAKSTLLLGVLPGEPTPLPAGSTTKFTPDVEGTYKVRLRVNGSIIDEGLSAVLYQPSQMREPLVGEQLGWNTQEGWARALKDVFEKLNWYAHSGTKPAAAVEHYGKVWHTLHGTDDLFEVCVKVGGVYQWVSLLGGGGGGTYSTPYPTQVPHGGIPAGRSYVNEPISNVLTHILFPYQYPAFTSFGISGQAGILEVGDSIPGSVLFVWGTSWSGNVVISTPYIRIRDITNALILGIDLTNDGNEAIVMPGAIQKTAPGTHTFRIEGINNRPAPGPDVFTRDATYTWYWRLFYGIASTDTLPDETAIEALAGSLLTNTAAREYAFGAGAAQYKYLAFPDGFTIPTTWTDKSTSLNVPFINQAGTVSVQNGFGQTKLYRVQRSLNKLGAAMDIIVA